MLKDHLIKICNFHPKLCCKLVGQFWIM